MEPNDVLASHWVRSPVVCLVALHGADVVGYLFSHAWCVWMPPRLHMPFPAPDAIDMFQFMRDMAITPAGCDQRLGEQFYATASASVHAQELHRPRLVAVQGMDVFWWRLEYQPADVDSVALIALHAVYGEDAELVERMLP